VEGFLPPPVKIQKKKAATNSCLRSFFLKFNRYTWFWSSSSEIQNYVQSITRCNGRCYFVSCIIRVVISYMYEKFSWTLLY
jgi:hypothetical protein